VAVGIIWGVVNNLLGKSKDTIESSTKCLDLEVRATKVVQGSDGDYNITVQRTSSGDDESVYAKLVLYSATNNSAVLDWSAALNPLDMKTTEFLGTGVANATKVDVTVYYLDENGNEKLCPSGTNSFKF
jgi:hypothetical protein